jgi:hypothetical protein
LVFSLHERLTKGEAAASHSFNIDPSYEFAKFLRKGCGLMILFMQKITGVKYRKFMNAASLLNSAVIFLLQKLSAPSFR